MDQGNVTVVGEETGGGAYGNTCLADPRCHPARNRSPFPASPSAWSFDKNKPKDGRGIQPEVFSGTHLDAIRRGADYKLDTVMELIRRDKEKTNK